MTEPQATKPAKPKAEPKTPYVWRGTNEKGEELFSTDELVASRFALEGASKAKVEKLPLATRPKSAK